MTKCRAGFASRDICCVGLAARNFERARGFVHMGIIIASSGLQLLWEGYGFFCLFLCASCII